MVSTKSDRQRQNAIMKFSNHFGTSMLNTSDLEKFVEYVHLCAYPNEYNEGDDDGRPPTSNHWTIFLELNFARSLQIDIIPGDGDDGLRGFILFESKDYPVTNKGIKTITITPPFVLLPSKMSSISSSTKDVTGTSLPKRKKVVSFGSLRSFRT
jgi:hypothetical protein